VIVSTWGYAARVNIRPLRADAERNRQRILAAARELFAVRGLDVTLDAIAEHAGLGVGTVYRRFANREELVDALFEERVSALVRFADQALELPDPWEGLVFLMESIFSEESADRGLREVILSAAPSRDRIERARERLEPTALKVLHNAQDAGALRADVTETDMAMVALMLGAVADASRALNPDLWRRYLHLMLDGLRVERDGPSTLPVDALSELEMHQAKGAMHARHR
jgi:AcrR family transcriptional regulator